jgi:hypothetical protein
MMNDLALFDRLGFNRQNGLHFFAESKWKNKFPKRVEEVIEYKLKPYAIYELNNEPFILFFENRQKPEVHKWCWNVNSSPIIIIEEENQIKIYNGFSFDNKKKLLHLLLEDDKNLDDFNYLNLVSGKFLEKYGSQFKETHRVDYNLLENIETARSILIDEHQLESSVVNNLIGRLLFTRYLIDRGVKIGKYDYLSRRDLLKILLDRNETYELFYYLRDKFNGNLFPIDEEREAVVNESHLGVFIKLFKGDELKTGQMSLFDFYDFSVIPIEFISNIYEFFLGGESQRRKGAYYTPPFLVDYILKETVDAYFKENCDNDQCKVLDPACGSGIFLVETLRRLIHRYQALNPDCKKDKERYKEQLKNLLCKNIFGVDSDENAVNVAVFSLYITLLDYQEPKDIEDFRFPILVGSNFFINDFFNTEADFGPKLKERNFDFIIGNPPWGNLSGEEGNNRYIEHCEKRGLKIGRKEISQAFLYRIGDFSTEYTKISLIVTSKNLYNIKPGSKFFRRYFLDNFKINQIFELSSVRRQVFIKSKAKAIAPPSIIFFQYANGQNTDDNVVKHISLKPNRLFELFNIFVIEKYDYKEVLQKHFKQYDWLFKVLVYGNILDFYFIKRLKESYPTINESIIKNSDNFLVGQGIMIGGGDKNDVGYLLNKPYIDTKNDLNPFFIELKPDNLWKIKYVHRPRNKELFNGNSMIMAEGLLSDLRSKASYLPQKAVFKSSITAIRSKKNDDKKLLKMLVGLFNSSLFSYFIMMTGSSVAIEREQTHDIEKIEFPFIFNQGISDIVEEIEENRKELCKILSELEKEILKPELVKIKLRKEEEFPDLTGNLNKKIYTAFELSNQEKSLVDYVLNVSIPLFNKKNIKKLFKEVPEKILEEYAQLFIDHFKKYFNGPDNYFFAEIHRAKYVVGINFVVSDNKPETSIKWIPDNDDLRVVELLSNFSFSEVSNDIFIQKDVKGFEKKSFYVIKPNQYKLWHKAIAYLDLNEFSDAILNSGRKQLLE